MMLLNMAYYHEDITKAPVNEQSFNACTWNVFLKYALTPHYSFTSKYFPSVVCVYFRLGQILDQGELLESSVLCATLINIAVEAFGLIPLFKFV